MTIRSKFLLAISLTVLLPCIGVPFALTLRPVQRFGNSKDVELKMSAAVAGQVYKQQEAAVLAGALDAAERIGAFALVEQLAVMQPIPGASSHPEAASLNDLQRENTLNGFNDLATKLQKKYNFDFLILTDLDGKVLAPANTTSSLEDAIKNNPLFKELKNSNTARVSSLEIQRPVLQLLMPDRGKILQVNGPLKVDNGLVIEAVAPILGVANGLLGVVFAGHLVNDSKGIVSAASTEISHTHSIGADVSIVFQSLTVATTVEGVGKGQGLTIDPALTKLAEPSVRTFDLGNHRVIGGFYPILNNKTVIGQIIVTHRQELLTDLLSTIGWAGLLGLSASFILTFIVVFVLTGRLAKSLRRINTDIIRIGLGDFDDPIDPSSRRDEAGDLVESLERLRVTVKQAIERLRRKT